MTQEEYNNLSNMSENEIISSVSSRLSRNPVFVSIVRKLVQEKLYSGLLTNPDVKTYGNSDACALDIIVDSISSEILNYYNTKEYGANEIAINGMEFGNITDVNSALKALYWAIYGLSGGPASLQVQFNK